ncbi:MAG: ATP synthase subunit I [Azoarcus sp.]|jgi:ATP synthase protein I|nr:ATP synthase subunit I [Azoarcus sp.]
MHRTVLLQFGATFLAAVGAAVFFGARGALSAMCGGLAYALPSGFFAWRLFMAYDRQERVKVTAFVAGELVKLVSVAGLLALTAAVYGDVHWGAFLAGLVLALKANLFAFLVKT